MTEYGALEYLDGWLCVRQAENRSNEPKRDIWFWPLAQGTLNWFSQILGDGFEGTEVTRQTFSYEWYSVKHHRGFILPQGGKTQTLKIITEDVPRPRVKPSTEIRWHFGHWEKYNKSKGWVIA